MVARDLGMHSVFIHGVGNYFNYAIGSIETPWMPALRRTHVKTSHP